MGNKDNQGSRSAASAPTTQGTTEAYSPQVGIDCDSLRCPRCGNQWLHHHDIAIWSRDEEDGPGTLTEIRDGAVLVTRQAANEIPHRRDTIRITFGCEMCGDEFLTCDESDRYTAECGDCPVAAECRAGNRPTHLVLEIEQHKGHTQLRWL
jgi:hypothetical protein